MRIRTVTVAALASVAAGALGCLAAAPPVAMAGAARPRPLTVASASLAQSAQRVVFAVRLTRPFSPAALKRAGRSLCLLIERPRTGAVTGQLCVIGPRRSGRSGPGRSGRSRPRRSRRSPRLVYQPVTPAGAGRAHVVAATITRSSADQLTATFLPGVFGNRYAPIRWQVRDTLAPPACTPRRPTKLGCVSLYPTKPATAELHTPRIVGCTARGPAFVNQGPSNRREIALTFDDGPWYDTPQFLDILERYRVPATFFQIGEQVGTYGQGGAIERRMLADGDMIGDHTWSHPDVASGGAFARDQIERAAAAIRGATHGFTPCLFRAPYGAVSPALISEARSLGFITIQWDVDPRDWSVPGVSEILGNVLHNAHPGAIVLQHDGGGNRSETLAALPQEIRTLRREGYTFVTVTQLLGQQLIYR